MTALQTPKFLHTLYRLAYVNQSKTLVSSAVLLYHTVTTTSTTSSNKIRERNGLKGSKLEGEAQRLGGDMETLEV